MPGKNPASPDRKSTGKSGRDRVSRRPDSRASSPDRKKTGRSDDPLKGKRGKPPVTRAGKRPPEPGPGTRRTSPRSRQPEEGHSGEIRLNRFISQSGICSRREADERIREGQVTVNGKLVTELGTRVSPRDEVKLEGRLIRPDKPVYILMNKPRDTITTLRDPGKRQTVMDLLGPGSHPRVYPVGRLDRNTTGVLLLTNDGDLAKKLAHPSGKAVKIYHVFLDKKLREKDWQQLIEGVTLEDGPIKADQLSFPDPEDKSQVGVELHSGRNRIVRRMFEHLGYRIRKLDRVYFAGLTKKGLSRGHWRYLTKAEITSLKMGRFS